MNEGEGSIKWKRLERTELLKTRVFTVVERENEGPGGRKGHFVSLEAPDWAVVVPLVHKGGQEYFLMARQYRHGSDELSVEFPGGVVEKGEEPEHAAARELKEETGCAASSLRLAASVSPNPAIMSNRYYVFLAEGIESAGGTDFDENEAIDAFLVPVAEVRASMGRGEYSHALMAAALFFADRLMGNAG
jgi:ADP-ribose pyrophosphatase